MSKLRSFPLFALALLGACTPATTTLGDVWVADDLAHHRPHRFVVIAIDPDEMRRRMFEDALAKRFDYGTASHTLMPFNELVADQARTRAFLIRNGYDGTVVVRLRGIETQESKMPAQGPALGGASGNMWGGAGPPLQSMERDYTLTTHTVLLEVDAYTVDEGTHLFHAISSTFNPEDADDLAGELFDAVRAELRTRGL